jgi:hypothetical protein
MQTEELVDDTMTTTQTTGSTRDNNMNETTQNNTQEGYTRNDMIAQNQPVGDTMSTPKHNNQTRIYLQNPNEINIGRTGDLDMILDHMQHMEIDIFVFPETNLNTHKSMVKGQIHKQFKRALGSGTYRIEMSASTAEYTGNYKPGGVIGGVIGRNKARIVESGHDKYGRWVFF